MSFMITDIGDWLTQHSSLFLSSPSTTGAEIGKINLTFPIFFADRGGPVTPWGISLFSASENVFLDSCACNCSTFSLNLFNWMWTWCLASRQPSYNYEENKRIIEILALNQSFCLRNYENNDKISLCVVNHR